MVRRSRSVTSRPNLTARSTSDRPQADWIAELAEPYLRGYTPAAEKGSGLEGYWFAAPSDKSAGASFRKESARKKASSRSSSERRPSFFVGYLLRAEEYTYLTAEAPECLVFVTLGEPGNPLHKQLVQPADGLLRKTYTYIGYLTHRPPRFAFFEDEPITMVRHRTMCDWPPEKHTHFSRNFFIETLAWLVRSGLVRKLAEAVGGAAR